MEYIAAKFVLKTGDRVIVEQWLRSPTLPQAWGLRAKILLASADGEGVREMARRLETTTTTVCLWRRRYLREGLAGLQTRSIGSAPAHQRSQGASGGCGHTAFAHGSDALERVSAGEGGRLSSATVHRIWQKHDLQPHRVQTFKFSHDPAFETKIADVVRLYLDPPERAMVLCVDEKSHVQALNRTQPILPLRPGLPARMTHDYQRNGTTSPFAALEVASGKVHGRCFSRHTHVEFIAFLDSLAKTYRRREVHLICDNYGTHKHPKVREWLAAHPRFHLHFTPTSASWLNLVERWFSMITTQAIRRGSFDSVRQLERAITKYLAHWNDNAKPFVWTRSPRHIRRSIRHAKAIEETGHAFQFQRFHR